MYSVLIVTLLIVNLSKSEFFTSIGHLQMLVESINGVTMSLEQLISDEEARLRETKKLVSDFRVLSQYSSVDPDNFIANPINAFLLIKKLSVDFQILVEKINNQKRIKEAIDLIRNEFMLPNDEDYRGAIEGIYRLEDTYQLSTHDISNGKLSQKYASRTLTAFECFELGRIAYTNQDYYHTIRWMQEALNQLDKEVANDDASINKIEALDFLAYSTYQQGNMGHALNLTRQILELDENYPRAQSNYKYFQEAFLDTQNLTADFKNVRPSGDHVQRELYETLCREGSTQISPKKAKKLSCKYIRHDPFIAISPIKAEQIFYKPEIWIFHEFVTNEQVQTMKNLASPKLRRAIVRNPVTGVQVTANYRISKSGWLRDDESPQLSYLSKLVTAVTNLTMETAEEWQVANYGIGGQYEPHFDFARKIEPSDAFDAKIGNRIATLLIYLEAPEKGGSTVFPLLNLSIRPKRRAAAFWYNLHTSGDGDYDTRHAACPVLFGAKWVSNKWIHYGGQEFRRPCSLTREYSPEMFD